MEVALLGLALAGALTAGIKLYATVLVLGLLQRFEVVALPGDLPVLADPWVLGAAGALFIVEFVADKVPWVDSLWDAVHTFIRVPAGAAIAWGAGAGLEPGQHVALALVGGTLALAGHGTKLSLRAGVNASPEPFTNWALSFIEDVFVIGMTIVAATHPAVALVLVAIFVALAVAFFMVLRRALKRIFRSAFGSRPGTQVPPAAALPGVGARAGRTEIGGGNSGGSVVSGGSTLSGGAGISGVSSARADDFSADGLS